MYSAVCHVGLKLKGLGSWRTRDKGRQNKVAAPPTQMGLFGHLLTREGSSPAVPTVPQACKAADAGLTKPQHIAVQLADAQQHYLVKSTSVLVLWMFRFTISLHCHAMILTFPTFYFFFCQILPPMKTDDHVSSSSKSCSNKREKNIWGKRWNII